jgi:hypothetical protein
MTAVTVWAAGLSLALAGPEGDVLPPPRAVPPPAFVVPPSFYRPSAYDVWRVSAFGMRGVPHPRVVLDGSDGPIYLNDGRPYEYLPTHPLDVLPVINGTPYR